MKFHQNTSHTLSNYSHLDIDDVLQVSSDPMDVIMGFELATRRNRWKSNDEGADHVCDPPQGNPGGPKINMKKYASRANLEEVVAV